MEAFDLRTTGASPAQIQEFAARFEVGALLGLGAVGRVHAAREGGTGRAIALKFCMADEPELAERFLREGRVMQGLSHPCVLTVYTTGQLGDTPYMATELIAGGTLRQLLDRGPLAPACAVRTAIDILAGLQACHAVGIVHRDLKPANILIEGSLSCPGRAKIADLGVAKHWGSQEPALTGEGMLLGTPAYMAPEQLRGEPPAVAADLYAAGVILYEMLAGRLPHSASTLVELIRAQSQPAAVTVRELAARVPEPVLAVLERLLSSRPADRPASAEDSAHLLRRVGRMAGYLTGQTTRVRPLDAQRTSNSAAIRIPPRSQCGDTIRRSPAALAMSSAPISRPTGRRPALPSMRSFRARSGQLLVPGMRASVTRALASLDRRALASLVALLAITAFTLRWVLGS